MHLRFSPNHFPLRRFARCGLALLSLALLTGGSLHAVTIVASQDNYGLGDANTGNPNQSVVQGNSGDDPLLLLKRPTSVTGARKIWFRFDLAGQNADLSALANFTITLGADADTTFTLQLYALETGFSPGSGVLGTSWTESALTWNNAPGNDTANRTSMTSDATAIGSAITINSGTLTGTSFTRSIPLLSDYVQADQTLTLMLSVASQSNSAPTLSIASSENSTAAYRPTLEFSVIPEPASPLMVLMAMAGLVLTGRMNRPPSRRP